MLPMLHPVFLRLFPSSFPLPMFTALGLNSKHKGVFALSLLSLSSPPPLFSLAPLCLYFCLPFSTLASLSLSLLSPPFLSQLSLLSPPFLSLLLPPILSLCSLSLNSCLPLPLSALASLSLSLIASLEHSNRHSRHQHLHLQGTGKLFLMLLSKFLSWCRHFWMWLQRSLLGRRRWSGRGRGFSGLISGRGSIYWFYHWAFLMEGWRIRGWCSWCLLWKREMQAVCKW